MSIGKINLYLLTQILKYFFLILFIFLSISWLLQITRLFTITNFLHIEVIEIIFLSFYLIPNLISVIVPFILIFGLILCFTKLNKDNELITILTLGLGLKPFKNSLFLFGFFTIILFTVLNFYIAPKIYEKYKIQEYELRNTINFDNIAFSNFLNLNNTTILDFTKTNNGYEEIFISFNDGKENIVYAKKGEIFNKNEKYNFQLSQGFKISIDKNKQIEKLEFENYVLKIENKNINIDKVIDKNTFTIFDDINFKNYLNLSFKFIDIILVFFILYIFYINNLKKINFETSNNIFFCLVSIILVLMNQILKNSEINFFNYLIIISILILTILLVLLAKKRYEQN